MEPDLSRRQFFRLRPKDSARLMGSSGKPQPTPIRPPGALRPDALFRDQCTRCSACIEACPHDALFAAGPETGTREGSPILNLTEISCRWCADFPCIAACPTTALQKSDSPTPVARIEFTVEYCLNAQGILCDTCATVCPTAQRAIRMVDRRPTIDLNRCTGCSLCVLHCEGDPPALRARSLDDNPQ